MNENIRDWDIYPTPFSECVTIQPDPSTVAFLESATNNGFSTSNPYVPPGVLYTGLGFGPPDGAAPFTDFGPLDHGANFDFKFNTLEPGSKFSFNIYYGAAANQAEAEETLGAVFAEAYSFGKPRDSSGACADTPNVYIFVSCDFLMSFIDNVTSFFADALALNHLNIQCVCTSVLI